jgi:hypothetical protein
MEDTRVSDLIAQLAQLQLEQNNILAQLADIAAESQEGTETRTEGHVIPTESQDETEIRIGDHVILLTGGVRCIKGDRARVTKVTGSSVFFTILRNQHNTYKRHSNVRKVQPS